MNTTLTLDRYRPGDIALVPCVEPDPIPDWPSHAEQHAHDLRSIRLGPDLLACIGFMMRTSDEADAFAVVNRPLAKGHGPDLARIIRERQLQWMQDIGIRVVYADCQEDDRPAAALLVAIGYHRTHQADGRTYLQLIREQ